MDDDTLLSDNLLPLDSSVLDLTPPEAQTQEISHERAMVQASREMLDEIIGWLYLDLARLDSITGLDVESPVDLKAQLLGREIAKTMIEATRDRLVALRDEHTS